MVLQLEELGCVTLMPFSHLLPSQQLQANEEAGLDGPVFDGDRERIESIRDGLLAQVFQVRSGV